MPSARVRANRVWSAKMALAGLTVAIALPNCSGETFSPHAKLFANADGTITGTLAIYVATGANGESEPLYGLRQPSGLERRLIFDRPSGAPLPVPSNASAGATIKVTGIDTPRGLRVMSLTQVDPPRLNGLGHASETLVAGTTFPTKRFAFVVVDVGGGTDLSLEQARAKILGPSTNADPANADPSTADPSLRAYYLEASYGTQDLDGQVFGPLSYAMTTCDPMGMAAALRPQVDATGGGSFNHYLWYIGKRDSSLCPWSGLAEVGTPDEPATDTWYNGLSSCIVMVQEPGHNFGMQHSSAMDCAGSRFVDEPNLICSHSEYGDKYDPMGSGCDHMNGWQKTYNGWLQGCNVVEARSSGTFTLNPIELPCDGAQLLKIPMPRSRIFNRAGGGGAASTDVLTHYFLELRTNRGIDSGTTTAVQVRVSGDIRGRGQRAVHTWLLDMNPTTSPYDGLAEGGTFTDPAGGVSFTIAQLDSNHATVSVTMAADGGGPVCLDGATPFDAPGPGIERCEAMPASTVLGDPISTPTGGHTGAGGMFAGTGGSTASGGMMGTGGSIGSGGADPVIATGGVTGVPPCSAAAQAGCGCSLAADANDAPATGIAGMFALGLLIRRRLRTNRLAPPRTSATCTCMIKIGDALPEATLTETTQFGEACPLSPSPVGVHAASTGKRIIIFGLPGAYTQTCSAKHVPGYLAQLENLKAVGVDEVWCVSVNDAYVMAAWGRDQDVIGKIRMLGDGSADFTKALGLEINLPGMGIRSRRYSLFVDNGIVKQFNLETAGKFEVSNAETILKQLS